MTQKTVAVVAKRPFTSVVWGNVDAGETFHVKPGYVAQLVKDGCIEPPKSHAKKNGGKNQ